MLECATLLRVFGSRRAARSPPVSVVGRMTAGYRGGKPSPPPISALALNAVSVAHYSEARKAADHPVGKLAPRRSLAELRHAFPTASHRRPV